MPLRNDEYWKRRAEQLEDALNAKNRQTYAELERIFDRAMRDIDKAIRRWYTRYLMNNDDISLAEAKRRLSKRELEEFKWDVQEYIRKGRENGVSADWAKQLENASARVHISRLEALKLELQQYIEEVYGQEQTAMQRHLEDTYRDTYYHQAFEVYQGIGAGWTFAEIDDDYLTKVLAKPWAPDRYNFSQRIWKNKEKLLTNAHQIISRHLILGNDPQKPIDELAKVMGVSKRNAGRLVMTESAYFAGEARKDCFNALGVERYKIIATLDLKTSAICREMDGQIFKQSEHEAGTTAPPFHPNCRTTTAPYYEDMEGLGERAARDPETGKTYRVPASMTYSEWYEKHVAPKEEIEYNKLVDDAHRQIREEYSTAIRWERQNRHIPGAKGFRKGRSELTADPEAVIERYAGTGQPLIIKGKWNGKERIVSSEPLGYWVNQKTGERALTRVGMIHYAKDEGRHIVPARPLGDEDDEA